MITFSPIQKLIQETLFKKMKMLDKTPPIEINQPSSDNGGGPQQNYMFARSVFLRMTSLLTQGQKPIVLMGGELVHRHPHVMNNDLRYGLEVYGHKSGGIDEENPNVRPMAGIKDVNVEYAGGGMKLGATRKTSVSWTCWSWDELQKFKPFFLKHGRVVLLEFGWGFNGPDSPSMLPIINENGTINVDLIKGTENQLPLQEAIPQHILKQKGHYDAVLGTIQNFEFSVNESGGFDCTTDLVSMGVNTLRRMDSKESVSGHVANLPILQPVKKGMWWWKSDDFLANQELDKNPYYSFKSYMATLEGHLHLNSKNSKGSIAYILGSKEPYCTWGWFEDNVLSRFAGQINKNESKVISEFRSIESVYDNEGNVIGHRPTQMRVSRDLMPIDYSPEGWFWINPESAPQTTEFWKDKTTTETNSILIPGTKVISAAGSSTEGNNARSSIHHNYKLLGDFKLMFGPPYVQKEWKGTGKFNRGGVDEKWKSTFMGSKTAEWSNEGSYFRVFKNDWSPYGVIRNIYFGHKFLTECFDKATIKEGVDAVWSKFSEAYGGIYDFGVEFDDKEGRLMLKDKAFSNKKVSKVLENKSTNENYDINDPGLFVFPIWEKTSLVKSQNLSAKLPSRMQIAAMYGNNNVEEGDGLIDNLDDWGAVALGRNEQKTEDEDSKRQKLLDSLMGSMEEPFKRGKTPTPPATMGAQFTFGRADADEGKSLQWREGTSTETTNIYEDFSKGMNAKNTDNDKFGRGINEHLEDVLKEEFTKRLLESTGLEDEDAIEEAGLQTEIEGKWNPFKANKEVTTEQKLADARDKFKDATTKVDGQKDLYKMAKSNPSCVYRNSVSGNFHSYGTIKNAYPIMKPEYTSVMRMALKGPTEGLLKVTDPLIPIELEIEIDGTGGIFPGNSFHSSYLPKSYMDRLCFQVIGASHKIDSSGWYTTLKGQMRVAGQEEVKPPERIEDIPGYGVLTEEELEKLPETKEFRKKEKEKRELDEFFLPESMVKLKYDEDIDVPKKDPPKVKPKKKKETEEFKREVKKMKETEPGSGVYKIGDSSSDDGSVIFVGSLGSDYDAGTGMVNTPTGQVNINDIQGTAGGTYDATTGNTFEWRVSDPFLHTPRRWR